MLQHRIFASRKFQFHSSRNMEFWISFRKPFFSFNIKMNGHWKSILERMAHIWLFWNMMFKDIILTCHPFKNLNINYSSMVEPLKSNFSSFWLKISIFDDELMAFKRMFYRENTRNMTKIMKKPRNTNMDYIILQYRIFASKKFQVHI